jgi:acetolactate synthase I/II/III large subunit
MKVYEALAQAFAAEGTSDVFTMMGGGNRQWLNALARRGATLHPVRHEGAGLSMADGFARVTHRPGVISTTSGPGITQLGTTMVVASRAGTPLVAFCGEAALGGEHDNQFFHVERYAAAVECEYIRLLTPERAYQVVRQAFYTARVQSCPVMLSVPEDVQQLDIEPEPEYLTSLQVIDDLRLPPAPERIDRAAGLIAGSERVVIIAGRGARAAGADDLILHLQRQTGALLATTLPEKNWLSDKTGFHAGSSGKFATKNAMELLRQADCVIGVGASLNRYTIQDGQLYPGAQYIQVDRRPPYLLGTGRLADCYVQADAALALDELCQALDSRSVQRAGYHTPATKELLTTAYADDEVFEVEPGTVDPREACRMIDDELPAEIRFVLAAGYYAGFGLVQFTRAREHILVNYGNFGAVGEGVILSIGAVIGNGRQPTALVEGDAGFMMYLAEFETACREGLPLLVIVMNDQALGAENHYCEQEGLDPELTFIPTPDLGKVAVSLGGAGALVTNLGELQAALRAFVAHPEPAVIDLRISRNVLTIPDRRARLGMNV